MALCFDKIHTYSILTILGAYGQMIAANTADISNNAGFISSLAACGTDYINNPDYGLSCCFEDTNNLGTCLCNGTTIDDTANPGSCCSANLKHPDHCLCSGTDIDDPNNPGNCCFKDESNPNQCLCNGNYTDNPNKSKTTMNVQILQVKNDICFFIFFFLQST